jgi:hypothetical protein
MIFLETKTMSLVDICAKQWINGHSSIIESSKNLKLSRKIIYFSDLRERPTETFKQICQENDIECSSSGLEYTDSFSKNWIMATAGKEPGNFNRWETSQYNSEIRKCVSQRDIEELSNQLGLSRIAFESKLIEQNKVTNHFKLVNNTKSTKSILLSSNA